jgi:hypothetical protein
MAAMHVNKVSAARRQIDAAIRMLFSGEDSLAVHTVAAAGCRLVRDLAEHRRPPDASHIYENALKDVYRGLLGRSPTDDQIKRESPKLKSMYFRGSNRPANFLKHADHDQNDFIDESEMNTDDLLLEASALYTMMGFDPTAEMRSFLRWHLAVYPHEDGDAINTAAGPVHELPREDQLEFGAYLLEIHGVP